MRLRHKPWAKDKLEENSNIVINEPSELKGLWKKEFENDNPIHIEIGSGKGRFITEMAKANPSVNYIAIEAYASVIVSALDLAIEANVPNIRLLNIDANDLTDYFADNEIDRVYLNFSDPWPKNRHEKRRLTYKTFLESYRQVLHPDGEIHFKTDNQSLFEYSLESFSQFGLGLKNVSLDLHKSDLEGNIMTEYEEKFSKKGKRIYRLEGYYLHVKKES
jgi:tRNA (guanine-N7-)-methyltransferase